MQINVIETRKTILIRYENINQIVSFTNNINSIPFTPDEVIVKMVTFNSPIALLTGDTSTPDFGLGANPYNSIVCLWSNLVNDFICSFTDVGNCRPNLHFQLKREIKGNYEFKFMDVNENQFDWNGDITIQLEFVKYREVKETVHDGGLVSISGKALQKIY